MFTTVVSVIIRSTYFEVINKTEFLDWNLHEHLFEIWKDSIPDYYNKKGTTINPQTRDIVQGTWRNTSSNFLHQQQQYREQQYSDYGISPNVKSCDL